VRLAAKRRSQSAVVGTGLTSPRHLSRCCGSFTSETTPAGCAGPCRGHFCTHMPGATSSPAARWVTSAGKGRHPTTCWSAFYPTIIQHRFMSACVRRPGAGIRGIRSNLTDAGACRQANRRSWDPMHAPRSLNTRPGPMRCCALACSGAGARSPRDNRPWGASRWPSDIYRGLAPPKKGNSSLPIRLDTPA
jgi:hypothetical protein